MNKILGSTALTVLLTTSSAFADPTFSIGLAFNFGGGAPISTGISAKVYSDDKGDSFTGAAGVTYFLDNGGYWGVDAGLGYLTSEDIALSLTYDFLNNRPQFGIGVADIC